MWQEEQAQLDALGKETSWEMYRRKLKMLKPQQADCFCGSLLWDLSFP
jgi:hypothetical protein